MSKTKNFIGPLLGTLVLLGLSVLVSVMGGLV